MTRQQRVSKLERAVGGDVVEFVGMGHWDWTPEQLEQAKAEAQKRLGPNATVIGVEYVSDWRGPRDKSGFPVVEGR